LFQGPSVFIDHSDCTDFHRPILTLASCVSKGKTALGF
jgi:hypothetical protein